MGSTFNPQILVDKLAKLNNSQQSIETLSHWCIFHMNKAKLVVETWDKQFHCSPSDQRLAFLYLANDILQNSRRKGSEFVDEFWKFLPDALRDVVENGDDFGRNAVLRLISIWEERKVFGSRGQILKDEIVKKPLDCSTRNGKHSGFKLKHPFGNTVDRIISGFQAVYGCQLDEDAIFIKCTSAIGFIEKVDKEIFSNISSEGFRDSSFSEEIQGQHNILKDCIEQIVAVQSSTESLASYLREALQEQEYKLEQIRIQLQAAEAGVERAEQLMNGDTLNPQQRQHRQHLCSVQEDHGAVPRTFTEGTSGDSVLSSSSTPPIPKPGDGGEPLPLTPFTRQATLPQGLSPTRFGMAEHSPPQNEDDNRKSTAAAMAAKLTASPSSAQMLTYVLSSLASEGVIGNLAENPPPGDFHSDKRLKHQEVAEHYSFTQLPSLPPPLMLQTHHAAATVSELLPTPPIFPSLQPFSAPFFAPTPPSNPPFFYPTTQQMVHRPVMLHQPMATQQPPPPVFSLPQAQPYQAFQGGDRALFGHHHHHHQSSLPTVPISRQ